MFELPLGASTPRIVRETYNDQNYSGKDASIERVKKGLLQLAEDTFRGDSKSTIRSTLTMRLTID